MNGTRTTSVLSAAFLLLSGALPALAAGPSRVALGDGQSELRGFLPVELACETCTGEASPTVGALWRGEDGVQERRTLRTVSWADGVFSWAQPDGRASELHGTPLGDGRRGWSVQLPLEGAGAPFRVHAQMEGHTAPRLAYWPARDDADSVVFQLSPVHELFDEHPEWSVERTVECDVLVPRGLGEALTFFADGRPVAWLYGAADERWVFQFVRPGGTLLDRVTVPVEPTDEGDALGFRLPLSGLLGHGDSGRLQLGAHADSGTGDGVAVTVGAAGVVDLADCPRIPVEVEDAPLERDGF